MEVKLRKWGNSIGLRIPSKVAQSWGIDEHSVVELTKTGNQLTGTLKPEVKMMIPIPEGFKAKGSVIAEQVRTLDLKTRWWKTTGEVLPTEFVARVVETFKVIIS